MPAGQWYLGLQALRVSITSLNISSVLRKSKRVSTFSHFHTTQFAYHKFTWVTEDPGAHYKARKPTSSKGTSVYTPPVDPDMAQARRVIQYTCVFQYENCWKSWHATRLQDLPTFSGSWASQRPSSPFLIDDICNNCARMIGQPAAHNEPLSGQPDDSPVGLSRLSNAGTQLFPGPQSQPQPQPDRLKKSSTNPTLASTLNLGQASGPSRGSVGAPPLHRPQEPVWRTPSPSMASSDATIDADPSPKASRRKANGGSHANSHDGGSWHGGRSESGGGSGRGRGGRRSGNNRGGGIGHGRGDSQSSSHSNHRYETRYGGRPGSNKIPARYR